LSVVIKDTVRISGVFQHSTVLIKEPEHVMPELVGKDPSMSMTSRGRDVHLPRVLSLYSRLETENTRCICAFALRQVSVNVAVIRYLICVCGVYIYLNSSQGNLPLSIVPKPPGTLADYFLPVVKRDPLRDSQFDVNQVVCVSRSLNFNILVFAIIPGISRGEQTKHNRQKIETQCLFHLSNLP
jgi:hypothetical protein